MRASAILFFFLILFMQQIGGYSPLKSGLAVLPVTVMMFVLSRRFGALADRFGPRFFMGAGPLVAAAGLLLFQLIGLKVDYVSEVLPGLLVFALGLSMTVAPLTAAVLQGAEKEAGIASGVNNAIARVAGLLGTAAVGAAIAHVVRLIARSASFRGRRWGRRRARPCARPSGCRLDAPDVHGLASAQARAITRAAAAGLAAQLPPRPGDRRGAGGRRRGRRSAWDTQPAHRGRCTPRAVPAASW